MSNSCKLRDDIAFLQAVQSALSKRSASSGRSPEDIDAAVRQLVAKAIVANDGIIDVFTGAGLKRPDLGILDDRFLAEIRGPKHKNVAAELLERLLNDEIATRASKNIVQSQLLSEMLKRTLTLYHDRAIATQEIIEELNRLARDLSAVGKRGEELGMQTKRKSPSTTPSPPKAPSKPWATTNSKLSPAS